MTEHMPMITDNKDAETNSKREKNMKEKYTTNIRASPLTHVIYQDCPSAKCPQNVNTDN